MTEILRTIAVGLLLLILLVGLGKLLKSYSRRFAAFAERTKSVVGEHALIFIAGGVVTSGPFLLGGICSTLTHISASPGLADLAHKCYGLGMLWLIGFMLILYWMHELEEEGQAGPRRAARPENAGPR